MRWHRIASRAANIPHFNDSPFPHACIEPSTMHLLQPYPQEHSRLRLFRLYFYFFGRLPREAVLDPEARGTVSLEARCTVFSISAVLLKRLERPVSWNPPVDSTNSSKTSLAPRAAH